MKKIAFIIHGKLRNKPKITRQIESAFTGNYKLGVFISEYRTHAIELGRKVAEEGYSHIICLGGDGTLNEVVNGIMQSKQRNVKVGVLPYGTGNDFIKTTKSPRTLVGIKKLIDEDRCKEIDLGHVKFKSKTGDDGSRYFINITDIGLGGVVVQKIGKATKAFGADVAYLAVIFNTLLTYRNQPIKVTADEFTFEGKVKNFVVANGKYFGSGIGIAPDAQLDSGRFDVTILGELSLFTFLKQSITYKKCKKVDHPQVKYNTAKTIAIESLSAPQPVDIDGEFVGYTPMHVEVQPKAISFLC